MLRLSLWFVCVQAVLSQALFGNITLLSYNVAGLPELLSSGNPAADTSQISPKLKPYNIINVEEDFNYHATLYAGDSHAYRTPTSGGAGIGSGLNSLSDFPFIDLDRIKWTDCYINSGDCLTPKGFTFIRVRVADGMWVDVYNLHADAGDQAGDINARSSNFAQLTNYINTWSTGMAVIVMGDTNSRYTRPGDSDSLHSFLTNTGTTDLWVTTIRGGSFPASGADAIVCAFPFPAGTTQSQMDSCETVDKIFIRSTPAISFPAFTFANANTAFQNSSGAPLSDHYPITSTLSWKLSSSIRLGDTIGGPHGNGYNDVATLLGSSSAVPQMTSITLRGASRLDGIIHTVQYPSGSTVTTTHGGTGGTAYTLTLSSGERITKVTACSGKYNNTTRLFYMLLTTNTGRTLSAGQATSDCLTTTIPSDAGSPGAWGLVGFWGRDGDGIDRAAPVWGASY